MSVLETFYSSNNANNKELKEKFIKMKIGQVDRTHISGKKFIEENFGKYAIVKLDFNQFKIINNPTYEGILKSFASFIADVYTQHDYIVNELGDFDK